MGRPVTVSIVPVCTKRRRRTVVDAVPERAPRAESGRTLDGVLLPRVGVYHERGEDDHLDADRERVQSVGDVRLGPVLRLMDDVPFQRIELF